MTDSSAPVRRFDTEGSLELLADPVAQWLDWEEQANLVGFRTSTQPVEVSLSLVPRDQLEVTVLPGAPDSIVSRFVRGDQVLCARHPLNRDASVAWTATPVDECWSARFTSSRTLALHGPESGAALFALKLATDHPHPDFHQPEKTKLREEAVGAVEWVREIAEIDALLGPLSGVHLVTEVLVVMQKDSETGFMVRDLRMFQDGHYYLPALSLPFVGRQIARLHGASVEAFWGDHYARAAGLGKARVLARYGMWFETPNPQNILVRLDRALMPSGSLVLRDVGDGECATDAFECSDIPWTKLLFDLRPETRNTFWAFGEAGENSLDPAVLERWYAIHDDAYFGELARWFPEVAPGPALAPEARLDHWNRALRSDAGMESVARSFASRAAAHAAGAGPDGAPG